MNNFVLFMFLTNILYNQLVMRAIVVVESEKELTALVTSIS